MTNKSNCVTYKSLLNFGMAIISLMCFCFLQDYDKEMIIQKLKCLPCDQAVGGCAGDEWGDVCAGDELGECEDGGLGGCEDGGLGGCAGGGLVVEMDGWDGRWCQVWLVQQWYQELGRLFEELVRWLLEPEQLIGLESRKEYDQLK